MDWETLKKSRGFTVGEGFTEDLQLTYRHSNLHKARAAQALFNAISGKDKDVCGGKGVGGYYAGGFITPTQAIALGIIIKD